MISELHELENIRRQQQSLLKESQARELKHVFEMCEISKHAIKKQEFLKNKYKTETSLVEEKSERLEEELSQTSASCAVVENELMLQNSRIANVSSINRQLKDFIASARLQHAHQQSFLETLEMNKSDQKEIIESVEVQMYEKTKEKAEIDIQTEGLIDFIAIFAKRLRENQSD